MPAGRDCRSDLVTEAVSESGKTKKSVYKTLRVVDIGASCRAAARAVELGEAPATVDFISTEGLKFFRGPLAEIDDLGPDTVLKDLNRLNDAIPERR